MVEEILSTAQLHRHLLDEPSQIDSDTPVANAQNFGYNYERAVEKCHIPTVLVTSRQTV